MNLANIRYSVKDTHGSTNIFMGSLEHDGAIVGFASCKKRIMSLSITAIWYSKVPNDGSFNGRTSRPRSILWAEELRHTQTLQHNLDVIRIAQYSVVCKLSIGIKSCKMVHYRKCNAFLTRSSTSVVTKATNVFIWSNRTFFALKIITFIQPATWDHAKTWCLKHFALHNACSFTYYF